MNEAEIQQTADLLAQLKPGFLPYPIFEQVARLVALPILEFIPLRMNGKKVEVLLIPRDDDDALWPGMLHTPGTVIRATDLQKAKGANWPAIERVLQEELNGVAVGDPHYVGSMFHESKRGAEQAQLYWIEVLESPDVGTFYSADSLPEGLIESQVAFIGQAVNHFTRER